MFMLCTGMSSAAEDAWKELQSGSSQQLSSGLSASKSGSMDALMKRFNKTKINGATAKAKPATKAKAAAASRDPLAALYQSTNATTKSKKVESDRAPAAKTEDALVVMSTEKLSEEVVMQRWQREVLALEDESSASNRCRALKNMRAMLFSNDGKPLSHISCDGYTELFECSFKPLFKRFADPAEKCREGSVRLVTLFLHAVPDLLPFMAYLFPALMGRVPSSYAYDAELQLFVADLEEHEAFKRGKATCRQDKGVETRAHRVTEPSEEVRVLLCVLVHRLIEALLERGTGAVLHPYFHELILFLHAQLHDPSPDLRIEACAALSLLAEHQTYELGMKFYAVSLVRALLPCLRHRLARVRIASLDTMRLVVKVPNRDKRKGAGTEAIIDLVGFREDNVLPVAAFYRPEVSINYLAQVAQDSVASVREHVALMISDWLTTLPDRYDYETRLLPYLLTFLCDPVPKIQELALRTIGRCGEMYESEHGEDVIEKRQYGVDGDKRTNHTKPLPPPFHTRPRLGTRLYVRGNTRRILRALLEELCNWICKTRLQSAMLLRTIIIFCEEHLVSEVHVILPYLYKALALADSEKDRGLSAVLVECAELLGRFTLPSTYVPLVVSRLRDEAPEAAMGGGGQGSKKAVLRVFDAMLQGSLPREILPHTQVLVEVLTGASDSDDAALWHASSTTLVSLLSILGKQGKSAVSAVFLHTGRLPCLAPTLYLAFRFLTLCVGRSPAPPASSSSTLPLPPPTATTTEGEKADTLAELGERGLDLLTDVEDLPPCSGGGRRALVDRHAGQFVADLEKSAALRPLSDIEGLAAAALRQVLHAWPSPIVRRYFVPLGTLLAGEMEDAGEGAEAAVVGSLADSLRLLLARVTEAASETEGEERSGQEAEEWRPLLSRLLSLCVSRHLVGGIKALGVLRLLLCPTAEWNPPLAVTGATDVAVALRGPMGDRAAMPALRLLAIQIAADLLSQCEPGEGGRGVARLLCPGLIDRLEDANVDVTIAACEALHALLPFLCPTEEGEEGVLGLGGFVEACLARVPAGEGECRNRLDSLLRVAVMQELEVSKKVLEAWRGRHGGGEVVDGLLDHVGTILTLRRR